MKKLIIVPIVFTLLFLITLISKGQNIDNIKRIVKELASEKYHGRCYTNNGANMAAAFIQNEYEKAGLLPVKDDWFQPFSFGLNQIKEVSLTIDNMKLKPGEDYVVRRNSPSINGKWNIIIANKTHFQDSLKMKEILKKDLSKYFVVVDFDDYRSNYKQYSIAGKLLFKSDANKFVMLHENEVKDYVGFGRKPSDKVVINIQKKAFPKDPTTIDFSIKTEFNEITTKNVLGYLPGKTYEDSIIIICGHYDHLGEMGPEAYFPGADDNATAIAAMIEMATFIKDNNYPDKSLLFAAFSAEEAGLIGSGHFVKNLPINKNNINYVINLDMMGFGDAPLQIWNGKNEPRITKTLQKVNTEHKLVDTLIVNKNTPLSDHYSFTEEGIRAVFLTTGVEPSVYYHTVKDTYENTPLTKIDKIIQLISKTINADKEMQIN